jgi:large subunit ribosomal protein L24
MGKQAKNIPTHYPVKRGDTVMVISGKDRGKTGVVKQVLRDKGKIVVEGINIIKKSVRANPMLGITGGIHPMEAPFDVSKVMLYSSQAQKPTRIKKALIQEGGQQKRVRVCRHTQAQLD